MGRVVKSGGTIRLLEYVRPRGAMRRTVTRLWEPYVLYGVLGALGMGTAYVPCNSTVVKWFARRRGLAVGVASTGGSLGTFALPPLCPRAFALPHQRR